MQELLIPPPSPSSRASHVFSQSEIQASLLTDQQELNLFSRDTTVKDAITIAEFLKNNRVLRSVTVKSQNIENKGAIAFAEMLRVNTTLQELNLMGDGSVLVDPSAHRADIEAPGGTSIARALLENNTLTKLDLSCNFIGDEGARAFAESVERINSLVYLNLSDNNISWRGANPIFAALRRSVSLEYFVFKRNNIPANSIQCLCDSLKYNHSITSLDLEGNRSQIPIQSFFDLLKVNNTLVDIKLSGADVAVRSERQLTDALGKNRRLQDLKRQFRDKEEITLVDEAANAVILHPRDSRRSNTVGSIATGRTLQKQFSEANFNKPINSDPLDKTIITLLREDLPHKLDLSHLLLSNKSLEQFLVPMFRDQRECSAVHDLILDNNNLSLLPVPALSPFQGLTILSISQNSLTELPSLANIPLLVLDAAYNRLTSLHDSIKNVTTLQYVDLSHNSFVDFPEEVFRSPNLQFLFLNHNLIQKLNPMDRIDKVPKLTHIDLSFNKLIAYTAEMCKIKSLCKLNLQHNELVKIPPEIAEMSRLTHLWLDANKLEYLPVEMHRLQKGGSDGLSVLGLKGNPLSTIPDDIKTRKKSDLMGYLKELEKGSQCYSVVKLVLCGDGNVGKSSLLRSFRNEESGQKIEPSANVATDGVDIHEWSIGAKNKEITFKSLDFAGQAVYYNTHQFFVGRDTLYIVVFNLMHETHTRVEYWLNTINVQAPGSPVFVVGTHADDKKCTKQYIKSTLDQMRDNLGDRFENIIDYIALSNKNGKGVKQLMNTLASVALQKKLAGRVIPSSWMLMSSRLVQKKNALFESCQAPVITMQEFKDMSIEFNVSPENLMKVVHFLHQVGTIVYLGDRDNSSPLRDMVFLDGQWLANVMSSIVSLKMRVTTGVLLERTLAQIWKAPLFPPVLHQALIKILERLEILYPLPKTVYHSNFKLEYNSDENAFLVPSFLAEERPSIVRDLWPLFLADKSIPQYSRVFEFRFLPIGFFSRLVVRTLVLFHPICFWQNGMVLRNGGAVDLKEAGSELGEGEDRALIEFNPTTFILRATFRGKNAGEMMQTLAENVDTLVAGWFPGQLNRVMIPCIHCVASHSYDPFMFDIADCKREAANGGQYVYCRGIRPVRVDVLASDVTLAGLEDMVIDYSHIDMGKLIGKGSYATVFSGVHKGSTIAVKRIELFGTEIGNMARVADEEDLQEEMSEKFSQFRREVLLMSGLKHPNIVQLVGICVKPFCMITEFLQHGDLYHFLKEGQIGWKLRIRIARDIALGMQFLHGATPPIIHRDLKTPNVLIAGRNEEDVVFAKVADFGLSVRSGNSIRKRDVYNASWLAPEIMRDLQYTEKVDVYSYGIILWEIYTRENPFEEFKMQYKHNTQLEEAIMQGLRPTIPVKCPKIYVKLIEDCWQDNPSARPSFDTIVERLRTIVGAIDPARLNAEPSSTALVHHNALSSSGNGSGSFFRVNKPSTPLSQSGSAATLSPSLSVSDILGESGNVPQQASGDAVEPVCEKLYGNDAGINCMEVVDLHVWCGCQNGKITVWNKFGRAMVTQFQAHSGEVMAVKMVGNHVWSSSADKTIIVWDRTSYKPVKHWKVKESACCIEPAGKRVWTASSVGDLRMYNRKDMRCARELKVDASVQSLLYVSPDKLWIGTEKKIIVMDTTNFSCEALDGHTAMVHSMVRVNDTVWSCSSDKSIRVWSEEGEELKVINGHSGRVFALLPVGEKHVWSSSWDLSIIIWRVEDYGFHQELKGFHSDAVTAMVAIEKSSNVIGVWSAAWDTHIGCWKIKIPMPVHHSRPVIDHQGYMLKRGGEIKTWKMRWFVLSRGNLSYYSGQNDEDVIHTLNVCGCPVQDEEVQGKKFCFSIETEEARKSIERRKYVMSCDSKEEKDSWMQALAKYSNNPSSP